ncbi:GIY-YIG nuclease family protein [Gordonia sp. DT218]|uniref:GIY-YIG nuclease family protein n=1 Tax=Gordonia sp. DT218 TaxID=3416659 RepID=UPI003CF59B15
MAEHAFVSWTNRPEPWVLEDELIEKLDLPLNLMGNKANAFHPRLTAFREAAKRREGEGRPAERRQAFIDIADRG